LEVIKDEAISPLRPLRPLRFLSVALLRSIDVIAEAVAALEADRPRGNGVSGATDDTQPFSWTGTVHGDVRRAILDDQAIRTIHQAALEAELGYKRAELFVGVSRAFVQNPRTMPNPSAQILSDIHAMNHVGRLLDGTSPIAAWLSRAEELAGSGAPALTFREMLARVRAWEEQQQRVEE
jgi:hypothetical protein